VAQLLWRSYCDAAPVTQLLWRSFCDAASSDATNHFQRKTEKNGEKTKTTQKMTQKVVSVSGSLVDEELEVHRPLPVH
jgi:hypothetical protein